MKQTDLRHPVVVGLQYGDEGKGKITDVLARQADWVIRFNGGNNAGHTLWLNGRKLVTHSVPSGVLSSHTKNFIGAGCVVDPLALKTELAELSQAGAALTPERLRIDARAHLILPLHRALDAAREAGTHGVGSTKRGIGPTYTTKTDRTGIRVGMLFDKDVAERVEFLCRTYNPLLAAAGVPESSVKENMQAIELAQALLRGRISTEITPFYDVAKKEKCVLEGAQGILLDIDHGTFPYVTSSNTLPCYAAVGTPFPSSKLGALIGVAKAYLTRVGHGPFATELNDETGERIRQKGGEFGATTGRPRRVGWLNADELKTAVQLSDCSHVIMTKADVLLGEKEVFALINGKLESFAGWSSMLEGEILHPRFEAFASQIEEYIGAPIVAVGTGPDRKEIHWRHPIADFWAL